MFEEIRRHHELQKANILRGFGINSEEELELEIFKAEESDIEKAKHNVGDVHPNGKWVWVQLPNGKFDWRTQGGRAHQRHSESQKNKEGGSSNKSGDNEQKTTAEHAAKTSTKVLQKVSNNPSAPQKLKDNAKKELSKRKEDGGNKEAKSKQDKTSTNETKNNDDGVKTMKAPRNVWDNRSFGEWLKRRYSIVERPSFNDHQSWKSHSFSYYHVKDKKGNVFTAVYTSNHDMDDLKEEVRIYPGQWKVSHAKDGIDIKLVKWRKDHGKIL